MTLALSFFAVGVGLIGLIGLKRRPSFGALLSFIVFLLVVFGVLSLGLPGSWLERLFRPIIRALGLYPESEASLWRISMMLSLMFPFGLLLLYFLRNKTLLFALSLLLYTLACDLLAHVLIRFL